MATQGLAALEGKFDDHRVTTERVTGANLTEAIVAAVEEPAVSTRLGEFDVSLDETPIVVDPTPREVWDAHTGVTHAAFAIADYGSLYLPHRPDGSELISLYVERHVAILRAGDIAADMKAAFERFGDALPKDRSSGIIATGPSATADMGELVHGAHGPSSVHVIVVTEDA